MRNQLLIALVTLFSIDSIAQPGQNLFVEALLQGHSSVNLQQKQINDEIDNSVNNRVIQILKQTTQNDGPLLQEAQLLYKFKEQTQCGRIEFWVSQPSSHTRWKELGGQLSICVNGGPPLQECPKKLLVPNGVLCFDKSKPIDTLEIKAIH